MASTYENDLRLEEMATGENSGSWGTKTNTNLELIADAFSYGTETIANADTTITIADGAADAARSLALKINSSEDLTTTRVVTLAPNTTSKVWIIENNTSGGQTLTISAGSGSNITLANGKTKIIATDGIGAGSNVVELTQDIAIADLFVDDDLTVGDDIIMNSDGGILKIGADADLQVTHSGTAGTITNASGDLTLDVAGDIILDADGKQIIFADGGTQFGQISTNSTPADMAIKSLISDEDIIFQGIDGGASITALTLDMSEAGNAIFNAGAELSAAVTITTSDNTAQLTLKSTDADANRGPFLNLARDNSSAADGDHIGCIVFNADDDANNQTEYASITGFIQDASNTTEDGGLIFDTATGGNPAIEKLRLSGTEAVFNEDSANVDFRVESNGNANMIFVDAGSDHVNIGTSSDRGGVLNVYGSGNPIAVIESESDGTVLSLRTTDSDANHGPTLELYRNATGAASDNLGSIIVKGTDASAQDQVYFSIGTQISAAGNGVEASTVYFQNAVSGTVRERITMSSSALVINQEGLDNDFRVESDGNSGMLVVDAAADQVRMGNASASTPSSVASLVARTGVTTDYSGSMVMSYQAGTYTDYYKGMTGTNPSTSGARGLHLFNHDNDSDGGINFWSGRPTVGTPVAMAHFGPSNVVFNDEGADRDFRVESDSNTHMLFVDAGINGVGIATSSPNSSSALTVGGSAGDGSPPLRVSSTIAASSTFNYVFQGHVTDLPNAKRAALSVGKAHSGYNQTIMGHYHASDGSTSNYGFLGMHNADDVIVWDGNKQVGIGTVPSLGARLESQYLGFNTTGNDNWKKGALALKGSFAGGLSFINDGGASDGFAFFLTGTPSVLNLRFGASGGTMSAGVQLSSTSTSWAAYSDSRLKTITSEISGAVAAVNSLRAVKYTLNEDTEATPRVGLIAQEVQAVLPEAVDVIDDDGHLGLRYTEVIPLLVAAIKEQKATIDGLETRLSALENA